MQLAQADIAILISIFKPLFFLVVLGLWGWVITFLDKDAEYYFLHRYLWNGGQLAAGVVGFGLWLLIPMFWVGWIVAMLFVGGTIAGYVFFRNANVPDAAKWTFSWESLSRRLENYQQAQAQSRADIKIKKSDGTAVEVPTAGNDPKMAPYNAITNVMGYALERGAQRIELVADAQKASLQVEVDGMKYPQPAIDAKLAVQMIDWVKEQTNLDLQDRRKKQTGMLQADGGELGQHMLGVTTAGSTKELSLRIEIDHGRSTNKPFADLGLLDHQKQQLDALIKQEGKVVLVAAPTHQGLSTTLYSLLQKHDPYTQSIVTLEDTVEMEIEGVNHSRIEPGMEGEALTQKLAAMLRQDPQVVMLSKLTEPGCAKVLAQGSETVRAYAGMRMSSDTFTVLKMWLKAVGHAQLAGSSLGGIITQRLVRKLCTTCRLAYKPDPDALRKLNLPPDKVSQLYKHSGQVMVKDKPIPCPACHGMGYRGRIGVFEVMVLDDTARKLVAGNQLDPLRAHLRKQRMLWLQEVGLARVVEGVTSISEIQRVLTKEE